MSEDQPSYLERRFVRSIPATTAPAAGACELWISKINGAYPEDILDDVERQRSQAYRLDIDRQRFVAGCVMARLFIAAADGVEPTAVRIDRTCKRCGEPHGKPEAIGSKWQYSVSHAGELVSVAFCHKTTVGLDIESVSTLRSARVRETVLTAKEMTNLLALPRKAQDAAFLAYWTRKEAVLKCLGIGLTVDPALLDVSSPDRVQAIPGWPDDLGDLTGIRVLDVGIGPGYRAAMAFQGASRPVNVYEVATDA